MNGLSNLFLKVDYVGDVARLSAKNRLLDDDFYNGISWSVGLKRFRDEIYKAAISNRTLHWLQATFENRCRRPSWHRTQRSFTTGRVVG
jgi:hypothetical protein